MTERPMTLPHQVPVAPSGDGVARRVTVVGPGFRFLSGMSVYTCRFSNALAERHRVSTILLDRLIPQWMYPGGARVGESLTGITYDTRIRDASVDWHWGLGGQLPRAWRMLRAERPDILVLQWWTAATLHTYVMLAVMARRLGIPVVIEFHELQDTGEAAVPFVSAYRRRVMPLLLKLTAGAVVHNEHDRRLFVGSYRPEDVAHLHIEVAPHGPYDHLTTDLAPADTPEPEPHAPAVTRLLFFGLIRPYKGLEDLVAAFDGLSDEEAARFSLTIVGETWENWTAPAEAIAASRHRDRITFINRYVSDAEAAVHFAQADAIVLPYRRGSASGPLQIAMSSGIHVVLYGVGGLVEAVRGYDGARLVTPGDIAELRAAILGLSGRADERFVDPHDWAANRASVERMIDALAAA